VKGTFFTGEGDYDVEWSLWDDLGRVCRQHSRLFLQNPAGDWE
jgi:hypothetical protein